MKTTYWPFLLFAVVSACHPASAPSAEQKHPQKTAAPAPVPAKSTPSAAASGVASGAEPSDWSPPLYEGSIYDLKANLTDENGKKVGLDAFRGHPVLITMFYSSCPNACPLLTSDLKRIDRELAPLVREKVRVLMISFDPAHDRPAVLEGYAKNHELDRARWKLTTAKEESAREIAGVLGIKYRKVKEGEYFHTSAIVLLDENGRPRVRLEGLGKDPEPILAALR